MNILERLIDVIAPHECVGCLAEGRLLCTGCRTKLVPTVPRCYVCAKSVDDGGTCKKCRSRTRLARVRTLAVYDGIAKTLIWKLKFERARSAGVEIGMMLAPLAKELANAEAAKKHPANTIVVHVPTATVRVRLRGYDQAAIIAREVAHSAGLRYSPLLARAGRQMQRGASRAQRKEQLQLAFRVRRPHLVKNAHIILVDDVITTGATLEAAAATLKAAGAKKVEAVTFAQA